MCDTQAIKKIVQDEVHDATRATNALLRNVGTLLKQQNQLLEEVRSDQKDMGEDIATSKSDIKVINENLKGREKLCAIHSEDARKMQSDINKAHSRMDQHTEKPHTTPSQQSNGVTIGTVFQFGGLIVGIVTAGIALVVAITK